MIWPGKAPRVPRTFQQHRPIDDHIIDSDGLPLHLHTAVREVMSRLPRLGGNGLAVEDDEVSGLPWREEAAVLEIVHQGGLPHQPVDRILDMIYWSRTE
jgi:hypothetical protein